MKPANFLHTFTFYRLLSSFPGSRDFVSPRTEFLPPQKATDIRDWPLGDLYLHTRPILVHPSAAGHCPRSGVCEGGYPGSTWPGARRPSQCRETGHGKGPRAFTSSGTQTLLQADPNTFVPGLCPQRAPPEAIRRQAAMMGVLARGAGGGGNRQKPWSLAFRQLLSAVGMGGSAVSTVCIAACSSPSVPLCLQIERQPFF